jgi:hypothetical protein
MLLKSDVNFTVKLEGGEGRYVYGPGCYIINTGQSPLELWGGGATETNGLSWHVLVEENRDSHLLN